MVGLWSAPASAAVTGTLSLGATTIAPGGSTSINATFDEDAVGGVLGGTVVNIVVTPGAGATGTVTLTAAAPCDDSAGTQVDCLWPTGTSNYAATVTATASADAGGPFLVTTSVTGANADTPNDTTIVTRPVAGPQTLTVSIPPTTTSTTTTTTIVPSTTTAGSTVAPTTAAPTVPSGGAGGAGGAGGGTGGLPVTGGETEWLALVGLLILAAGGTLIGITRRPARD